MKKINKNKKKQCRTNFNGAETFHTISYIIIYGKVINNLLIKFIKNMTSKQIIHLFLAIKFSYNILLCK